MPKALDFTNEDKATSFNLLLPSKNTWLTVEFSLTSTINVEPDLEILTSSNKPVANNALIEASISLLLNCLPALIVRNDFTVEASIRELPRTDMLLTTAA